MQPLNVVVAQADCVAAEHLAISLHKHFRTIAVARDVDEVRREISRIHANAAVIDLELFSMNEVRDLCDDFHQIGVVCTHRVPDEEMWAAALGSGASDCCARNDLKGLVEAISRSASAIGASRAA